MKEANPMKEIESALVIDPVGVERKIAAFIKKKVGEAKAAGVVIGLSGGVDSSTVAFICAKALGPDKVWGVSMPEAGITDPHDVADARDISNKLGMTFRVVDITPAVRGIRQNLTDYQTTAQLPSANIRPRVRMTILYYYANLFNLLVAGSGNRSELRAGYFTKFGDGAVDILPLGCLYKTQVKQLAAHMGVSAKIIKKVPTAGLWRGQTDEGELGISYEKLDMIYSGLDLKLRPDIIAKAVGVGINKVRHFIERERAIAHKLLMPEIPRL